LQIAAGARRRKRHYRNYKWKELPLAEPADVAIATASLSEQVPSTLFVPLATFLTQTAIDPSLQLDISFLREH